MRDHLLTSAENRLHILWVFWLHATGAGRVECRSGYGNNMGNMKETFLILSNWNHLSNVE